MILKTTNPMRKYNFVIDREGYRKEIINLFLSFVQINIFNKLSSSNLNSDFTILRLFFTNFIIKLFDMLSIYYKKVLNIGVSIHV